MVFSYLLLIQGLAEVSHHFDHSVCHNMPWLPLEYLQASSTRGALVMFAFQYPDFSREVFCMSERCFV